MESAGVVNKLYRVNDDYRAQFNSVSAATRFCSTQKKASAAGDEDTFDRGKVSYLERI